MVSRLRMSAVVFDYAQGRRALDGVDVELPEGELAALIGPNGSGKSTLLRLAAGLLAPTSGRAELDGKPLTSWTARARAREVAFVPAGLRALPERRVFDFVLGGRYPHLVRLGGIYATETPADRTAVESALEAADAAELGKRKLDQLSSGQFQRVLVARALAQEARILLCDEPTAALDPEHQVRIFLLLEGLARAGRTVLVATHELNLASRFAARCLLLDAGRLAASGTPEDVLRPEVLGPVFGRHLLYARAQRGPARPLVVPWPAEEGEDPLPGESPR